MKCIQGQSVSQTAKDLKIRQNTVIDWRRRFQQSGIAGLYDLLRSGKPPFYGQEFRDKVLEALEQTPPALVRAVWDGTFVAEQIGASVHTVWRVLRKEGICLGYQRRWCVNADPEFVTKTADIVGLYLNPSENALVISIDEKPSIQALEIATGAIHTQTTKYKRRVEFLGFMDRVVAEFPEYKAIHVIVDNYCIHKKNEA